MDAAQEFWQGRLSAITGLKMTIVSARSRHKYGQNRPAEARREIAERLTERAQDKDGEVARQVLARL
jgi:predicted FMN-binding regulatory protein PaiB